MLGEESFTYSDVDDLEIKKITGNFQTSCDDITNYLRENLENNWFYWNTCREITHQVDNAESSNISFYVIALEEDEQTYIYQKHYLDFKKGLYGIYNIKAGEWSLQE
jgi:hypothetical protein